VAKDIDQAKVAALLAIDVADVTAMDAKGLLADLADMLGQANAAYHTADAPVIDDAAFDALKRLNSAVETAFPALKRDDSPSEQVGAPVSEAFTKVTHAVRMLSLGNAFSDEDVADFAKSVRKFLNMAEDAPLPFTAEPKIDGLSLSLRGRQNLCQPAQCGGRVFAAA